MSRDMPPDGERGSFLQRWSRRKLEEKSAPVPAPQEGGEAAPSADAAPEQEEPFDLSILPSIEELTGESDLSVFLQKGVPDALRNAAMRKVWSSNPLFSEPSGPLDYAWDFNDPHGVPGFGPMDANYDTGAMLRRIFGESEPEQAVETKQNTVAETEKIDIEQSDDLREAAAIQPGEATEHAAFAQPEIDAKLLKTSQNEGVFEEGLKDPVREDGAVSADPAKIPSLEPRLENMRLRKRHGGAVPL